MRTPILLVYQLTWNLRVPLKENGLPSNPLSRSMLNWWEGNPWVLSRAPCQPPSIRGFEQEGAVWRPTAQLTPQERQGSLNTTWDYKKTPRTQGPGCFSGLFGCLGALAGQD